MLPKLLLASCSLLSLVASAPPSLSNHNVAIQHDSGRGSASIGSYNQGKAVQHNSGQQSTQHGSHDIAAQKEHGQGSANNAHSGQEIGDSKKQPTKSTQTPASPNKKTSSSIEKSSTLKKLASTSTKAQSGTTYTKPTSVITSTPKSSASTSSSSASSGSSSVASSPGLTSSSTSHSSIISTTSALSSSNLPTTSSSASATASVCAGNDASDRSVWCDYDINTNYYDVSPDTGVTVEYWFELSNITAAPNGVERTVLAVNGSIPGPTVEANWGDNVVIHVTNNLQNNGSTIHWHGIRQNHTNPNDGVSAITQCPIAPGDTMTYKWKATQYGTSWYHSHHAMQAWDGVFGPIVIHGPATANYDHDLGSLFLNDWDSRTADQLYAISEISGPPTQQTGLINGTNTWNDTVGTRFSTTWESGSSYLLRVVNAAIDTHFSFTIDNHTLQVIASDFVPIFPYTTDVVSIAMGQRYDIIVKADQASVASDFWLRAVPDTYCSDNENPDDIKGIVHYGDSTGTPTTSAWTIPENDCNSEPSASIVPYLSLDASTDATVSVDDEVTIDGFGTAIKWYLGDVSMVVNWTDPTSLLVVNNETSFQSSYAVVELATANAWTRLVIESTFAVPHPIHLHGHDFFTLASGTGTYADAAPTLQTSNPPRRDVDVLPASGYLVIAFKADNPGIWLAHCHIGWHTGEGFALQFVERYSEIAAMYDKTTLEDTCSAWDSYQTNSDLIQDDSGI